MSRLLEIVDLGRMRYRDALEVQHQLVEQRKQGRGTDTLFFAAGINDENDGLFGTVSPADDHGDGDGPGRGGGDHGRRDRASGDDGANRDVVLIAPLIDDTPTKHKDRKS